MTSFYADSPATLTIFDCDGVLVDSELIALEELAAITGELGRPMTVAACRDAFMGRHNADLAAAIERRVGRPVPGLATQMRARMIERMKRELQPVPGVASMLTALDDPRCVASSSDRARIALTLELTGLAGFFGGRIFSGAEVARGKPHPDLFLHAAASMGFAPADCIVVEDSVMGVQAGVAAGMPVVGFAGGAHAGDALAAQLHAAGAAPVVAIMSDLPAALAAVRRRS